MPSDNLVQNPSFDQGLDLWTVTQDPPNGTTVVAENGHAIMDAGGISTCQLRATTLIVGAPVTVMALISEADISGACYLQADDVNTRKTITGPGLIVTSGIASANFTRIICGLNSRLVVEWVSTRRLDQNMSTLIVGIRDFDGDKPQTSLELGPVTDGASYVTREAQAAAVRDAVNAVCGNIWRYQFLAVNSEPNDTNAANQAIQANHRWKVSFVDSVTGDPVYWYIPTADLTVADLLLPSSSKHNPATQAWIDFKAAVNGIAINKKTGSTMNVVEIEYEE